MIAPRIEYTPLQPGEEDCTIQLVLTVFGRYVAPYFSDQGIASFQAFACTEALQQRIHEGSVVYIAKRAEELVGVVEVRQDNHVSMLFVNASVQGQGVGQQLVHMAITLCQARNAQALTVNASPNALGFYQRMGFEAQSEEHEVNGIRFIPMKYMLSKG
ncbi:GNAT family N-acetyltransferase [Desulfovibrio inopinatus]|uniref:GNAT family N-acetyltransferase n=1 Tax=Desulfovibrio inopinatus TaxID=102109 RepID=UPI000487329A|nr:GNAT family N-acetyltransferase [Desulfovibrio inopinatus]